MEKKTWYCLFYVFLLMSITPAMCRRHGKHGQSENRSERRRYVAALLPALPGLAGTAVVPWLFLALVAVYGTAELVRYAITENTSELLLEHFFHDHRLPSPKAKKELNDRKTDQLQRCAQDRCYPQNVCANNRGHCRDPTCWSHEYPLWQLADVCGGACPCCVVDYVYKEITGRNPPAVG